MKAATIQAVVDQWRTENGYLAGERLFALLQDSMVASFARRVLEIAIDTFQARRPNDEVPAPIGELRALARDEDGANGAYAWYCEQTSTAEPASTAEQRLWGVAAMAAKVLFNSTKPLAPFDADPGARLCHALREFARELGDETEQLARMEQAMVDGLLRRL